MNKYKKDEVFPLEYGLYKYVAPFIGPILYEKLHLTPNMITTVGNVFGIMAIKYLIEKRYALAALLAIIRQILDGVDGYVARKYNLTSKIGNFYDHCSDRIFGITLSSILILHISRKYNFKVAIISSIPLFIFEYFSFKRLNCLKKENECKDEKIKHAVLKNTGLLSNLDFFVIISILFVYLLSK